MIKSLKKKYPRNDSENSQTFQDKKSPNNKQGQKGNEEEKKKLLEAKIRKQVACEEKAFRIIERLIENPITEEFLIDACQFIAPHHYEDIVEERSITKTCGYPLCSQPVTSVPKQKYHISTKDNKVYDITERKNFCSNHCYKASKHLHQQLLTSPLWSREEEGQRVKVKLLTSQSGLPGIEVVGPLEEIRKDVQQLYRLDRTEPKDKTKKETEIADITLETKRNEKNIQSRGVENVTIETPDLNKDKAVTGHKDVKSELHELNKNTRNTKYDMSAGDIDEIAHRTSNLNLDKTVSSDQVSNLDSDDECETEGVNDIVSSDKQTTSSALKGVQTGQKDKGLQKGNIDQPPENKMDHLMRLLDRRKQLLGQLEEIDSRSNIIPSSHTNEESEKEKENPSSSLVRDKSTPVCDRVLGSTSRNETFTNKNCENKSLVGKEVEKPSDAVSESFQRTLIQEQRNEKQSAQTKTNSAKVKPESEVKYSSCDIIQMICRSVHTWISPETLQFLQPDPAQTSIDQSKADYDTMYQALCRRLDAGEFEIEDIGCEAGLGDEGKVRERVPNYKVLKVETEEFTQKVKQYFSGEKSAFPIEKEDSDKTPVYLPTVDTYDQMQIRRKIVMERLEKVLQDILTPLKLTIQDVYAEYKGIIATFRLDSKNIVHKPAEWTIINLILLRLLSRKNEKIRISFLQPSSAAYFKIFLGKIGTDLQQIDSFIDNLLLTRLSAE